MQIEIKILSITSHNGYLFGLGNDGNLYTLSPNNQYWLRAAQPIIK